MAIKFEDFCINHAEIVDYRLHSSENRLIIFENCIHIQFFKINLYLKISMS